jgi:DNA-binding MarR family transcriptional regulator
MTRATGSARRSGAGGEAGASAAGAELEELRVTFKRLLRTVGRVRGRDSHLGGTQLSHAQFELLVDLHELGELSASELAAAAGLTPGTVTQMLEGLAASGHVVRARSGADRRVVVSRLTSAAAREIERRRGDWLARWQRALADLPAEDLRAARTVLERVAAMLGSEAAAGERERARDAAREGPECAAGSGSNGARRAAAFGA